MTGLPAGRQRARSEEEKEARRTALLDAARALLTRHGHGGSTMTEVAAAAGISKASAYLYFPTKESLLVTLLRQELVDWFVELTEAIGRVHRNRIRVIPRLLADTLVARPLLVGLLAQLHGTLEANLSEAEVRAFKKFLAKELGRLGDVIEAALDLPHGAGTRLMLRGHALAIGLGQMATPPPVVQKVLDEEPELSALRIDLADELASSLEDLLRAWRSKA